MATWKDRLKPASIGGIDVFFEDYSLKSGRKIVRHEMPGLDEIDYEDLGMKERTIALAVYLIGDDVDLQRDKLEAKMVSASLHRLILPSRSVNLLVRVEDYGVVESRLEGRYIKFDLALCVVRESVIPNISAVSEPLTQLQSAKVETYAEVDKDYQLSMKDIVKTVNRLDAMNDIASEAIAAVDTAKSVYAPIEAFKVIVDRANGKINTFVLGITSIPQEIKSLFDFGTDSVEYDTEPPSGKEESTYKDLLAISTTMEYDSQYADIAILGRSMAAMGLASAATSIQFVPIPTDEKATELRDLFVSALNDLESYVSDNVYSALEDLRAAFFTYIESVSVSFAKTKRIVLVETKPSLALSHALYSNIDKETSILDTNKIRHPMFVSGGKELKVVL